jgi:hypothetical protein
MESVATCKCGCQYWVIHSDRVVCSRCKKTYGLWPEVSSTQLSSMANNENFFVLRVWDEEAA